MNTEPEPTRPLGRWKMLLAAPERGSASPSVTWLTLGMIVALIGGMNLCTAYLFNQSLKPFMPLWLSWVLVAVPFAALLTWLMWVDQSGRIKHGRAVDSDAP